MTLNVFPANVVVCPNCSHTFSHNKINGVAMIQAVADIDQRKRMHIRLALDTIENHMDLTRPEFDSIKKVFLDSFNDFNRDVQTVLGLADDLE